MPGLWLLTCPCVSRCSGDLWTLCSVMGADLWSTSADLVGVSGLRLHTTTAATMTHVQRQVTARHVPPLPPRARARAAALTHSRRHAQAHTMARTHVRTQRLMVPQDVTHDHPPVVLVLLGLRGVHVLPVLGKLLCGLGVDGPEHQQRARPVGSRRADAREICPHTPRPHSSRL